MKMQTVPLTKLQLIEHLETALMMVRDDSCDEGTISWNKTAFGTYETIALLMIKNLDNTGTTPIAIGDVNG